MEKELESLKLLAKDSSVEYSENPLLNFFWMKQKTLTNDFREKTMARMKSNNLKVQINEI